MKKWSFLSYYHLYGYYLFLSVIIFDDAAEAQRGGRPSILPPMAHHDLLERSPMASELVTKEISNLTMEEISTYPISSLSMNDIEKVFGSLSTYDLTRLLLGIPHEDLIEIENKLGSMVFNQTINRLTDANKTQVVDKLSNSNVTLS